MKINMTVVMGMHRSGTSMLTRMLNICGMYLGEEKDMMKSGGDNPEGFWENLIPVSINDRILSRFGGSWKTVPHIPNGWIFGRDFSFIIKDIRNFIDSLGGNEWWGFKDPRMSLTFSLWNFIYPFHKIICLRNPYDVAKSLNKRDKFSLEKGIDLWFEYNKNIVSNTNKFERIVVCYEDLITDPSYILDCLLRRLKQGDISDEKIQLACSSVKKELHHHNSGNLNVQEKGPLEVYQLFEYLYNERIS